ncbi:23S rRNA (uracil(1939)-C(5))-methyltransferase RlmD [Muribaculum sp. An289]|uniref:23S rRNA (uracil(1939)-C(5))-methyltransferase RlmD n=1 Tax=unclassified Muribaculum TaxID=2622126 RepID=UPI000B39A19B|nr:MULTISPECIES: 23S rRNA (uracil(1939)-C(5))-methyltransferase RlmD [unclassified Muribaculum]OUO36807.1 23S rRNA (uracil(1939)-C(5))-methyltransferase RlmD [Muribaculum sp. An289]OUO42714.1 23S rRNA (uracil(1939)-C(5))-methyltransferase RlmD [Muribaculum sp. An287]
MARKKKEKTILHNVLIEEVAAEGNAIARVDGKVLFVPQAVPGDVADICVTKSKKNYMEGYVADIIHPSPYRQKPFCIHYGICGGCKWQPLPYRMQLEAKEKQVYDQLVRIGRLDVPEIEPIIGSEKQRYYRNKLEFTFSKRRWLLDGENPDEVTGNDRLGLGFHVGRFFDKVLDIKECHLQPDPSNDIRLFIKRHALENGIEFFDLREHTGVLRNLTIRTASSGETMIILSVTRFDEKIAELLNAVADNFPQISSVYYFINTKANDSTSDLTAVLYRGKDTIYEEMEGLRFRIGPKSFFQTNSLQAYNLYKVAREFAGLTGKETVYDLYTGTGTIAQFVSSRASKVIGIEYVREAVEDAAANCRDNGISNCEFFAGDMKDILTGEFLQEHGRPDVIILDPPRAGIHPDVAKTILEAAPERIVYVSCNPASQARDIALLSERYSIGRVRPVDMFPQTHHVENIVLLNRK